MKHLRKLAVLVVALVAVLALSGVAWADDGLDIGGSGNDWTVTFTKEIKIEGSTGNIYAPNYTYTYSVDSTYNEGKGYLPLEPGADPVAPGVTIDSISFGSTMAPQTSGFKFSQTGTIHVTLSSATTPNVYMYKIDESTDGKTSAGITFAGSTYNETRYLIIAVGDTDTTTAGIQMGVLVAYLYTDDSEQNSDFKTNGWTAGDKDTSYDKYVTTSVTVTKRIAGRYADPNTPFPFTIKVICSNGSQVTYKQGDVTQVAPMTGENSSLEFLLSHEGTVTISGVPINAGAIVDITETNTQDSDYLLYTDNLNSNASGQRLVKDASYNGQRTIGSSDTSTVAITFTNELPDISGTGLVLRVAPYAIVVGAGAALFFVARRRKESVY